MKIFSTLLLLLTVLHHQQNTCRANDLWDGTVRYTEGSEFLFVPSIGLKNYGDDPNVPVHICNGVLIAKRYVLTLSHCQDGVKDLKDVQVGLGYKDLRYVVMHPIETWTTFKFWAKDNSKDIEQLEHNISIIKIDSMVKWASKPVVFTNRDKDFFYGKQVKIVFWGPYEQAGEAMRLKVAEMDVTSSKECMEVLNNTQSTTEVDKVDKSYLCTKINLGVHLEDVHSGTPLLSKKNKLIAINDPTYLQRKGIYAPTNVNYHIALDYYREFIESVTGTKCSKWWSRKRN